MFTDRRGKNSLTSTFINTQENLIGTRKLTQQDIQTRSQFTKKSRNNANNNATEHFPHSSNTYNSKKNYSISANDDTIHNKTVCYSKILKKWIIKHLSQSRHHDKQLNKKRLTETTFQIIAVTFFAKSKTTIPPI